MTVTAETQQPFAEWAIVELLGHRRLAGYLQEVQLAGAGFLRLDIPEADGDPARTQYIAPGSVYALHPVTESTARAAARQWRPEPVSRWELTAIAGFPNPPYEAAGAVACTEDDMSYLGDKYADGLDRASDELLAEGELQHYDEIGHGEQMPPAVRFNAA